jgi:hypothetical protein
MVAMKPIQKIPLRGIDLSDDTFSVNFMPNLQRLRSSIETIGLIQPVLLKKGKGPYQVVFGFRRIWICKELSMDQIPAIVFEEGEKSDLELFNLSLHENLTGRGLNTVEKAIALQKLTHCFSIPTSEILSIYLPLFSLEPNEKILKTYLSLGEMEGEIKTFVLKEEVSRSNIRWFAQMSSEERMALLPLLSRLKLGENRLREILTLLNEICRRDQVGLRDVIDRPEIQGLLFQKELTPIQRTERVKRVLMGLRYPKMRSMEEAFEKKRKELHLPSGTSLYHSPNFEGKGLRIEFQFESMEEYRAILSDLNQLTDKETFRELVEV